MRFEVNVDDGANLDALHKAREAYNAANGVNVADMPSFVQVLMDGAVAGALQSVPGPTTLSDALAKIAALEAEKQTLAQEVAAFTAQPAVTPAPQTAG